eukprot:CAMPEP_0170486812 /NCGR_PEP_ID=MMETSP0208-20121228/5743_1 /TAXON_ID=197538 /ORGANISM="Strombidium inclinatum, Strain S3" /LENGTH=59 /DNA_ID=CAMNT_0010760873 /DNA_START=463 /DNA_END=642 /DNA_ORIENTATION=-
MTVYITVIMIIMLPHVPTIGLQIGVLVYGVVIGCMGIFAMILMNQETMIKDKMEKIVYL